MARNKKNFKKKNSHSSKQPGIPKCGLNGDRTEYFKKEEVNVPVPKSKEEVAGNSPSVNQEKLAGDCNQNNPSASDHVSTEPNTILVRNTPHSPSTTKNLDTMSNSKSSSSNFAMSTSSESSSSWKRGSQSPVTPPTPYLQATHGNRNRSQAKRTRIPELNDDEVLWKASVRKFALMGPHLGKISEFHGKKVIDYSKQREDTDNLFVKANSLWAQADIARKKEKYTEASELENLSMDTMFEAKRRRLIDNSTIFDSRNRILQSRLEIDLHGQFERPALDIFKQRLWMDYTHRIFCDYRFITGKGGEGHGKGSIKAGVTKHLKDHRIECTWEDEGGTAHFHVDWKKKMTSL